MVKPRPTHSQRTKNKKQTPIPKQYTKTNSTRRTAGTVRSRQIPVVSAGSFQLDNLVLQTSTGRNFHDLRRTTGPPSQTQKTNDFRTPAKARRAPQAIRNRSKLPGFGRSLRSLRTSPSCKNVKVGKPREFLAKPASVSHVVHKRGPSYVSLFDNLETDQQHGAGWNPSLNS